MATILSAQCTDRQVNTVTKTLFVRYPTVEDYAQAPLRQLERAIHATGFYRTKARYLRETARRLIARYGGRVPQTMDALLTLHGVARKTANIVLGKAFGKPAGIAVDTHVGRIACRLGLVAVRNPLVTERVLMHLLPKKEWTQVTDVFIAHGRALCKALRPVCQRCPLSSLCPASTVRKSKK